MPTDFEELFDDVMYYAKKKLGSFQGKTKEDLEDYIADSDPQQKIKRFVRKELVDTSRAERVITEVTPVVLEKKRDKVAEAAVDAELKRKKRARAADESKDAKVIKDLTKQNLKRWKKNPGRFDLRGIDTRSHNLIRQEINARIRKAKRAGFKVGGVNTPQPYRIEKRGTRRSLVNGRFMKR